MAAATYDDALVGGTTDLMGLPIQFGLWYKKYNLQDLVELCGQTVVEANDVFQLLNIPANTFVLCAGVIPTTAEGAVLTADLGDGTTADGFVDGVNLNSTTALMTLAADGYGVTTQLGKFYTEADTLDLKIATTAGTQTSHNAEFVVWAIMGKVPTE